MRRRRTSRRGDSLPAAPGEAAWIGQSQNIGTSRNRRLSERQLIDELRYSITRPEDFLIGTEAIENSPVTNIRA